VYRCVYMCVYVYIDACVRVCAFSYCLAGAEPRRDRIAGHLSQVAKRSL